MTPCNKQTIPSHSVASEWFCNTLLTSNTHLSNETSLFCTFLLLRMLNLGVFTVVLGGTPVRILQA